MAKQVDPKIVINCIDGKVGLRWLGGGFYGSSIEFMSLLRKSGFLKMLSDGQCLVHTWDDSNASSLITQLVPVRWGTSGGVSYLWPENPMSQWLE